MILFFFSFALPFKHANRLNSSSANIDRPAKKLKMASELLESPIGASEPICVDQNKDGGKSWEEIKLIVKDTRKMVSSLASKVPSNFQFRTQETSNGPITR